MNYTQEVSRTRLILSGVLCNDPLRPSRTPIQTTSATTQTSRRPKSWHGPDEESMQGLHWPVKMNPDLDFQRRARSIARPVRTSLRWVALMNPSLLSLDT
ncbi:hypothetical protein M6B38_369885 [Iris pallida]|uniref:Uncharacterized protein n=1 Tax=Iris pallida TaxID=29817 RepID=A0AAX6GF99_IRIPA|nr:hypothetical protein M6B38_369885 [Iris pallida]